MIFLQQYNVTACCGAVRESQKLGHAAEFMHNVTSKPGFDTVI
jgi:hypothetical protein